MDLETLKLRKSQSGSGLVNAKKPNDNLHKNINRKNYDFRAATFFCESQNLKKSGRVI